MGSVYVQSWHYAGLASAMITLWWVRPLLETRFILLMHEKCYEQWPSHSEHIKEGSLLGAVSNLIRPGRQTAEHGKESGE